MTFSKRTIFQPFKIVWMGIILFFLLIGASSIEGKRYLLDHDELELKIKAGKKFKRIGDFIRSIQMFEEGFRLAGILTIKKAKSYA